MSDDTRYDAYYEDKLIVMILEGLGAPSQKASSPSGVAQTLLNPRASPCLNNVELCFFAQTEQFSPQTKSPSKRKPASPIAAYGASYQWPVRPMPQERATLVDRVSHHLLLARALYYAWPPKESPNLILISDYQTPYVNHHPNIARK